MRNKEREAAANKAVTHIVDKAGPGFRSAEIGIILGTGWGDVLMDALEPGYFYYQLDGIPAFKSLLKMPQIEGHHRALIIGWLDNQKNVAMLRGRIHMNEMHDGEELAKMVRLQVELLIKLGVKHLILTNAAGSLRPEIGVGDIVAHDGFVTLFAPPLPLWAGEFVSPEDTLTLVNINKILDVAYEAGLKCHVGAGAMVRGPYFEGRKHDKRILRECGAAMAMMSILPEAAVAALYPEVNVYALSFITNTASEEHSHEENQKRAKESSGKLGNFLLHLIKEINQR